MPCAIPLTRPTTTASHATTADPATTEHSRPAVPTGGFTTIDAPPRRVAGVSHPYGRNSPHSAHPQPAATILATMPTDAALKNAWYHASQNHQATATIPGWGDAICFNELHHTTPYHNTWD